MMEKMKKELRVRFSFLSLKSLVFIFLFLSHLVSSTSVTAIIQDDDETVISISTSSSALSRSDFPPAPDFVFGAGSSAYQVHLSNQTEIEGAAAEDGRKPCLWDPFTHAGKTADHGTGDIASDLYHKYKEDVKLMHETGLDSYRFSISWSRVLPDGHGDANPKVLNYYNNLINELVSYGIEPHVTLYHYDLPQALQDEYEGFLSPKIIRDFTAYADLCFREFGDRVKSWTTFNEPNILTVMGNDIDNLPPARCSYPFGVGCPKGNSTTEPYIAAHNIILAHASAANLYREKYQVSNGKESGTTAKLSIRNLGCSQIVNWGAIYDLQQF